MNLNTNFLISRFFNLKLPRHLLPSFCAIISLIYCLTSPTNSQFVPGFLVESGTDLQEWPKNLSHLFPEGASPEEQQDYYANAVASIFQAGTVAAPVPDNSPVEQLLGGLGPDKSGDTDGIESPQINPDGTVEPLTEHENLTDAPAHGLPTFPLNNCSLVAFSVARANYKYRKAGTAGVQVLFDKVLSSVGPGLNHTGGYFRCECPGYYFLSIHGVSPLQGRARLDLMRNRQRVTSTEAQYYGFGTGANSVIVRLYRGDIVYVFLAEGFLYENDAKFRGYASLSGFKIG